jgi:hypothetical protein
MFFPFHHFAHGALHGLSRTAHATASAMARKEATCERCGFEYVYLMFRSAHGRATKLGFEDHAAAEARAQNRLQKMLRVSWDPVPCPMCGWYQPAMVRRARQLRHRWMMSDKVVGWLVLSMVVVPSLLSILVTDCAILGLLMPDERWRPVVLFLWCLTGAGVVLTAAAAVMLPFARWLLSLRYDPNAEDEETRKQQGRARAVSRAEYHAGEAPPAPPCEE